MARVREKGQHFPQRLTLEKSIIGFSSVELWFSKVNENNKFALTSHIAQVDLLPEIWK